MTSILKVSTIQNTAGGAPTAADLGLNVTGSVLQVKSFNQTSSVTYSASSAHKILEVSGLVTKAANSKFLFWVNLSHNAYNSNNADSLNISFTAGYKTGAASSTASDYTGFGGRTGAQVAYEVSGLSGSDNNPFYNTDVPEGQATTTYGSNYYTVQKSQVFEVSPNVSAGTTINFAVWAHVNGYLVISGADYFYNTGTNDYNGMVSTLLVQEIAG
jgi:hypothetical protein